MKRDQTSSNSSEQKEISSELNLTDIKSVFVVVGSVESNQSYRRNGSYGPEKWRKRLRLDMRKKNLLLSLHATKKHSKIGSITSEIGVSHVSFGGDTRFQHTMIVLLENFSELQGIPVRFSKNRRKNIASMVLSLRTNVKQSRITGAWIATSIFYRNKKISSQ